MSRHAEPLYGENVLAVGRFETGDTVNVKWVDLSTDSIVAVNSTLCTELSNAPGYFIWDSSDPSTTFDTPPTGYNRLICIMTNQKGREHPGRFTIGGFPTDSAKRRFQQRVWINTGSAYSGTAFDVGTPEKPVNNVADARDIADREGLTWYNVKGPITLTVDHEDWRFEGVTPNSDIITVQAPASVDRSTFDTVGIRGALSGTIAAEKCIIGAPAQTVSGLSGTLTECGFDGTIQLAPFPGRVQGLRLSSLATNLLAPTTYLDFDDKTCWWLGEMKGIWALKNMSQSLAVFAVSLSGATLELESSVTNGHLIIGSAGSGELTDNKVGAAEFNDYVVRGTDTRTLKANSEVVKSTDPWQEKWTRDGITLVEFDLYDKDLVAINDSNPITGNYVRRRVVP